MSVELSWDVVKEFYQEKFGIEEWVVEMYANLDILMLCASGACNETISNFLEIPTKDVQKVIKDTFEFDGWETDLPINPYMVFEEYLDLPSEDPHLRFYRFVYTTLANYPNHKDIDIEFVYKLCGTMHDIEERISNEWI